MKKTIFKGLVILLSLFTLASCSKSDEEPNNNGSITGEWNLIELSSSGVMETEIAGQDQKIEFKSTGSNFDSKFILTDNPNQAKVTGSYDIETSTTINGITTNSKNTVKSLNNKATWSKENSTLTLNGDFIKIQLPNTAPITKSGAIDYTIEELTDTTLRLSSQLNYETTINGITTKLNSKLNVSFKR